MAEVVRRDSGKLRIIFLGSCDGAREPSVLRVRQSQRFIAVPEDVRVASAHLDAKRQIFDQEGRQWHRSGLPICDALELTSATILPKLGELEAANMVIGDPPIGEDRRGVWVTYRVNDAAVTDLYLRLGLAIGEY